MWFMHSQIDTSRYYYLKNALLLFRKFTCVYMPTQLGQEACRADVPVQSMPWHGVLSLVDPRQ